MHEDESSPDGAGTGCNVQKRCVEAKSQHGEKTSRSRSRSPLHVSHTLLQSSRFPHQRSHSPRQRSLIPRQRSRSSSQRSRYPRDSIPHQQSHTPCQRSRSPYQRSHSPYQRSLTPRQSSHSSSQRSHTLRYSPPHQLSHFSHWWSHTPRRRNQHREGGDLFLLDNGKFQRRVLYLLAAIREKLSQVGQNCEPPDTQFHLEKINSRRELKNLEGHLADEGKKNLMSSYKPVDGHDEHGWHRAKESFWQNTALPSYNRCSTAVKTTIIRG
ncbi:zinc finger Ran-binding domain-containing protein 2-like [Xyrauchen texanus]|uniref:zinc finger Ran-binding domain-containing protein 2-like n=1 Tax=Xyrauchen texanus TaxID=154827 RepID=UPI002241ACDA|nr:zinc finger Ran-binding domain-containing protein 2-like [Xyrauchen texanus]